ncbi:MAG TPA: NrfD/PsrC family molybdoenzyme membrane anchor subunit [Nocardioides sp.]|uniref:NrfD/PsrC family molybdoenzyme membrane anchor subunit n=1 Tax=Nocardioides sp. TaxID=35761 RepID=UPI002F400706
MAPRDQIVPDGDFSSYYGRPILKAPTWKSPDIPLYFFLGGMAGASAVLAEGAAMTGRPGLERVARLAAAGGASVGTVALVHDLGRPERFLKMLRVVKPTSPLSVGSFILAPFSTLSGIAAASQVTGWFPRIGRLAGLGAAAFGPPLATYTAGLIANTAIPAWHEAHRELPFVFGGSGAAAAGGVGMLCAPYAETGPALRLAVAGAVVETAAAEMMSKRLGMLAEPYHEGRSGKLMKLQRGLTGAGLVLSGLGLKSGPARRLAGAALVAGSLVTRFGIFEAGKASAKDPKYTVVPQRERLEKREPALA